MNNGELPAKDDHANKDIIALEEKRLHSEILRNESEARKFDAETANLGCILSAGRIVQLVVGALVAAGLFAAWFTEYFQPILRAESDLAKIEVKKAETENQLKGLELAKINLEQQEENRRLVNQNKLLENRQKQAVNMAEKFKEELSSTNKQLLKLSESAEENQTKYRETVAKYQKVLAELDRYIKELEIARKETSSRIDTLERRDATVTLTGVGATSNLGSFKVGTSERKGKESGSLTDGEGRPLTLKDGTGNPLTIKDGAGN